MRRTTFAGRVPGSRLEKRTTATEVDDVAVASAAQRNRCDVDVIDTTLVALVSSVGELTSDDREVVATVRALLRSGAVRLRGTFRDCPIARFPDCASATFAVLQLLQRVRSKSARNAQSSACLPKTTPAAPPTIPH